MEIKFDTLTDQQCVDIIAHFVKRKMVGDNSKIVIHTPEKMDITITRKKTKNDLSDDGSAAALCAAAGCLITPM